jgi:hypothetical protein
MTIRNDNGKLRYSIEDNEIVLELVEVKEKRKGTGTELINQLKEIAAEHQLPITLCAYPEDDSITQDQLNSFYEGLGFKKGEECYGGGILYKF